MALKSPAVPPKFAVPPQAGVPKAKLGAIAPKVPHQSPKKGPLPPQPKFPSSTLPKNPPPPMPKVPAQFGAPTGNTKAPPLPAKKVGAVPQQPHASSHLPQSPPKNQSSTSTLTSQEVVTRVAPLKIPPKPLAPSSGPPPMPKVMPLSAKDTSDHNKDAIQVRSQIARRPSEPPPMSHVKKSISFTPAVPKGQLQHPSRRPSDPGSNNSVIESSSRIPPATKPPQVIHSLQTSKSGEILSTSNLSSTPRNESTHHENSPRPLPGSSGRLGLARRPSEPVPPSHLVRATTTPNSGHVTASPRKDLPPSLPPALPQPLSFDHSSSDAQKPQSPPPPVPMLRSPSTGSQSANPREAVSLRETAVSPRNAAVSPRGAAVPLAEAPLSARQLDASSPRENVRQHSKSNPAPVAKISKETKSASNSPRRPSNPPPVPKISTSHHGVEKSALSAREVKSASPHHISFKDEAEVFVVPAANQRRPSNPAPKPLSLSTMALPPPMTALPPPPIAHNDDSESSDSSDQGSSPGSSPSTSRSAPPSSLPPSLPPVPPSATLPPSLPSSLPPPPTLNSTSSTMPISSPPPSLKETGRSGSGGSSPSIKLKKDKKEKEKEKKEEKDKKKKEKVDKKKEKDDKKKEKKDVKSATKLPPSSPGTPRADNSADSLTKEERRKQEEEAEEAAFSATFDKTSFLYNRCKNFAAPEQLEGKFKMKTTSWAERYLVLYCDFILYYDPKSGVPRDFDKPLGALPLDSIAYKRVKDFEDRMDLTGLIPKTISYENCFEVPMQNGDGKERIVLLQFDTEATKNTWRERIKSQAKNIDAVKTKVTPELKGTIELLANKYPITTKLKENPYPGEEEKWIQTIKDHWAARTKYRKDLRRAQLFSDFYIPNYKSYIDWFVTSGGEAGVASLEKELMIAEDNVIAGWKKEFTSGVEATESEIDELDKDNEVACQNLLQKIQRKSYLLKMYKNYYKDVYPTREQENFDEEAQTWANIETLLKGYIKVAVENKEKSIAEQKAEAIAKMKQAELDRLRREEERRNDPFGAGDDDDPFADVKIVGI